MSDGTETTVRTRLRAFRAWRRRRPFWGGVCLLVAAVLTAYLPATYDSFVVLATGSFTGPALLFGVSMAVCGLVVLAYPPLSSLLGLLGMLLSTLAILGALGGFVVGSLLGGVGSVLAFAWTPPDGEGTDEAVEEGEREGEDTGATVG